MAFLFHRGAHIRRPAHMTVLLTMATITAPCITHADTEAEALLSRVQATLASARTLSASFTISTVHPTRYADAQEQGRVTLSRPNLARIEITRYRKPVDADRWIASGNGSIVVADGHNISTLVWHPKSSQVRIIAAPPEPPIRTLDGLEPVRGFFARKSAGTEPRLLGVKIWEGARYAVVEERIAGTGPGVSELYIGADNLIHRLVNRLQVKGKEIVQEVALHDLYLNPPVASDTFVFAPPANAVAVGPTAKEALLSTGTEAPDLQVEDTHGKPVHLSDFRGKVVVLKFFATWCWTCKQSLPDANELANRYANRDVVVLAVDIWNSREAFRAWSAKSAYSAIRFAHDDNPQGKDAASILYHVTATPTEFVIGKDGKILASHTGYEGPDASVEKAVTRAIQSARDVTR